MNTIPIQTQNANDESAHRFLLKALQQRFDGLETRFTEQSQAYAALQKRSIAWEVCFKSWAEKLNALGQQLESCLPLFKGLPNRSEFEEIKAEIESLKSELGEVASILPPLARALHEHLNNGSQPKGPAKPTWP
jgi:uncharacterized coiled-coil protein SlyX